MQDRSNWTLLCVKTMKVWVCAHASLRMRHCEQSSQSCELMPILQVWTFITEADIPTYPFCDEPSHLHTPSNCLFFSFLTSPVLLRQQIYSNRDAFFTLLLRFLSTFHSHGRSEVKARQDVKPDFRHPPFTDYRQPPVDYRHPPVTDYRQPPTLDYRHPPGLLDFRQHPAAAQFPLGIPADFRPQVELDQELSAYVDRTSFICMQVCNLFQLYLS